MPLLTPLSNITLDMGTSFQLFQDTWEVGIDFVFVKEKHTSVRGSLVGVWAGRLDVQEDLTGSFGR